VSVTLVPVLCSLLLGGTFHREDQQPRDARRCSELYRPALERPRWLAAARPATRRRSSSAPCVLARGIGSEFMPPLNEGDLMFMPIADPSISLEENTRIAAARTPSCSRFLSAVRRGQGGAADTSTDPAPLNMTETVVHLKPPDQWRPA
jgi:Cu(I)/Ag(I) efflux system membrane protein CusA/SilA